MDEFLADYRETVESAAARLRAVPEEQAHRVVEGGWSAQQIIGHLIDSAANNHQRFVRAQFTDQLTSPATSRSNGCWPNTMSWSHGRSWSIFGGRTTCTWRTWWPACRPRR